MWTVINKNDYNNYLLKYPNLEDYKNEIILYETANEFILPRLFYYNYPDKSLILKQNNHSQFDTINVTFKQNLLDRQKSVLNDIQNIYLTNKYVNGIIEAQPGFGKTVMSIYLATQLFKLKPIFIIDNTKLSEQWIADIIEFTSLTKDDIGIIQGSKIEYNKKVYIGFVQTFSSKIKKDLKSFYNSINKLNIGVVFYDECHKTTSAEVYSKSSLVFNTKNIIGLSATPFVSNLHKILLYNTIGKIISKYKSYEITPTIIHHFYDSKIKPNIINSITNCYYKDPLMAKSKYNSIITTSKEYVNTIYNIINNINKNNNNRRIIVICFTKKQIEVIYEYLKSKSIESIMFFSKQTNVDKDKDKILIATYAYASHGFNYKALTDIILACPLDGKKSLIQCVGRVLRECDGKTSANVYDLQDTACPIIFENKLPLRTKILKNEFNCNFKSENYVDIS